MSCLVLTLKTNYSNTKQVQRIHETHAGHHLLKELL